MLINDPKTGGSISVPVQFEEVDLDEGYEKVISLWMKDAFAGVDFHFKSGALHVPKGYRGKIARRMAVDKIKAPVGGIKEEVELDEAKDPAYPPTIKNLKMIVKDKQNQIFMFPSGKARVDLFTASAMVQVYDALKPATKKKFEDMIKSKEGFMKSQAFAMKMAK
jgi:hypothetical protein